MRIAIAGATGFIGQRLIERLRGTVDIIGLTRRDLPSDEMVEWRCCDLFSLRQLEAGLQGADVAVYLVHSMLPPARLTQGRFEDLDLLLADNFARAARQVGVSRIVYLGGMVPDDDHLSRHLASRLEVERALGAHGVPVVALRAGIVLGAGGSSFDMIERLVRRLPAMICPKWTRTLSQPVAAGDAVEVLARVAVDPDLSPGAYDLAGKERLSYLSLMQATAEALGLRRPMLPVAVFSPRLSRLWLQLITGAPKQLVLPLIESLRHPLVTNDHRIFDRYGLQPGSIASALAAAVPAGGSDRRSRLQAMHQAPRSLDNLACSVQRLPLPAGDTPADVARRYASWLRRVLRPLILVETDEAGTIAFAVGLPGRRSLRLLVLTPALERSDAHRHLFLLTGGRLVRPTEFGRFEFRGQPGSPYVLAAVADFAPALPWWLYRWSQAIIHLAVMALFRNHLAVVAALSPKPR